MTPKRILQLLGTRDQRVFVLGVNEERITLLSQQTRALNLIHALNETWSRKTGANRLSGSRVAVVGGGAGAATAAVAAARVGAEVTLLAQAELLGLQRTAAHRFLHPFSYEWPSKGWNRRAARLPVLDWSAGDGRTVADHLAEQVLREQRRWGFELHEEIATPEIDIDAWTSEVTLRWRDPADRSHQCTPDIVILAVGFGVEASHPDPPAGVYWNSYWYDDDLAGQVGTVLVSGHGDGGLTEVLRSLIDGFDHEEIVALGALALRDGLDADVVNDFELDLAHDRPGRGTLSFYQRFNLPRLQAWIDGRLKPSTSVTLACRGEPLQRTSSPLNRMLIAQIAKGRDILKLDHRGIDVTDLRAATRTGATPPFDVRWSDGDQGQFDVVVVRHGTSVPRPLERYSGSFPPVLSPERVGEPLGWALDLTRFQWWSDSTFRTGPRRPSGPTPPRRRAVALVRPVGSARGGFPPDAAKRLMELARGDQGVALWTAAVAWAGDVELRLSDSLSSRLLAGLGDRVDAVRARVRHVTGDEHPAWWDWRDLRADDRQKWEAATLAAEQLILGLAGRRVVAESEKRLIDHLRGLTDEGPVFVSRMAEAYRQARPDDPSAALQAGDYLLERDRGGGGLHALWRAARLGSEGDLDARRALVRLASAELGHMISTDRRRQPHLLVDDGVDLDRLWAGTLLLALSDPIEPEVVWTLLGEEGLEAKLTDLDERGSDPVIEKAAAFVRDPLRDPLRQSFAETFRRTLRVGRLRDALGWPQRPVKWNSLSAAVGSEDGR